ncbi:MAG: hypothetical protein WC422_02360 [Candidatus Paceibacterota bacterium]
MLTNIQEAITFNATPKTQVNVPLNNYSVANPYNNANLFESTINNSTNLNSASSNYSSLVTHYSFDLSQGKCVPEEDGPYTSMTSCTKNNQSFNFISDSAFDFSNLQTKTSSSQNNYSTTAETTAGFEYSQSVNDDINFYTSSSTDTSTVSYRCNPATGYCSTDSKLSGTAYTSKDKCNANCEVETITSGSGATYNPSVNFNLQFNQ